jgi:hypothetical protein
MNEAVRRNEKEEQALIFVHIPKTAGSTLNYIIESHFTPENSFGTSMTRHHPEGTLDGFMALSPEQRAPIRLLNGHMGFGLHERLPRSAAYVTILRHPVERVLSHYAYECQEPTSPIHEQLRSGEADLKDFVYYYATAAEADNLQTRILSGNWHKRGYGPCSEEMLETAKENIRRHFVLVGLTERFDETYLLLRRHFGWPYTVYIKHNRTRKRLQREELAAEELDYIRQYNRFDLELYEFAARRFEEQVRQQGALFPLELRAFRACNSLYGLYHIARTFSLRQVIMNRRSGRDSRPVRSAYVSDYVSE